MRLILSILIPTVPNRAALAELLWMELESQAGTRGVEVLMLRDNKQRTIGAKRQALLDIAQGEYMTFVDDDDEVSEDYIVLILKAIMVDTIVRRNPKPDIVVHPIVCTVNDAEMGIVEMSVKHAPKNGAPLEEYKPGRITYRPPHELAIWKTELARQSRFPDTSQGEDFAWAAPLWPLVKLEGRIDHSIYHWRHNIARREHHEEAR